MAIYKNMDGTLKELFSLGKGSNRVDLRSNSGVIEFRDNGGSWAAIGSGLAGLSQLSTGLITTGEIITINGDNTLIDLTALKGLIIDSTTDVENHTGELITKSSVTEYDLTTTADAGDIVAIYLSIASNGDIIERLAPPTSEEARNTIDLGLVARNDADEIVTIVNTPINAIHSPGASMQDFIRMHGGFSRTGNAISEYSTNLQIKKTAGEVFSLNSNYSTNPKNPHTVTSAEQSPITFGYKLSDGTDINLVATAIDPNNYDDGSSTPAAVPAGKFTIQRISMFAEGHVEILYGQQIFHLMSEAKAALPTLDTAVPADSVLAIPLSYLIVMQGTTDLSVETDREFFKLNRFGEMGGIGYQQLNSAGMVYDPILTDNVNGTIDVGDGVVNLFQTSDFSGDMKQYTITGLDDQALTDLDTNYVVADYNSGSPIFRVTLDVLEINESDIVPVYTIYRDDNNLEILRWGEVGSGLVNKLHARFVKTNRFGHESGVSLGESGTRNITSTSGVIWVGGTRTIIPAANSSTDKTEFWYHVSGVWTESDVTTYNNTQYDDGTDLQTLGGPNYGAIFVYQGVEADPHLYYVLGADNYTLSEAQASQPPGSLPEVITSHAVLIGRIIVPSGDDANEEIDSAFVKQFVGTAVTAHDALSGLQGGTASEYYHLVNADYLALTDANAQLAALHTDGTPTFGKVGVGSSTNNDGDFNITGSNTTPIQGAEQVTNGDFTTDLTGWTNGGNWSQSTGTALHASGSVATLSQDVTVAATDFYLIEFDITGMTVGSLTVSLGGVSGDALVEDVTTYAIMIEATNTDALVFTPTSDFDGAIDNISVTQFTASASLRSAYNDSDELIDEYRLSGSSASPSTYFGLNSGRFSTATNNFALGSNSLEDNTTGGINISIGPNTLRNLTSGARNVAIGQNALNNIKIDDDNTAIGQSAMFSKKSGSRNVAIGRQSGQNNTNGSDNVFLGYRSGREETGSNKLYIANSDTATPLIYGEFDNQLLTINGDFTVYDTATNHTVCTGGAMTTTSGIGGRIIGARDDASIIDGNLLFSFRGASTVDAGTTVNSAAAIRFEANGAHSTSSSPGLIEFQTTPDASTTLVTHVTINSVGNVGMGTADPKAKLQVHGALANTDYWGNNILWDGDWEYINTGYGAIFRQDGSGKFQIWIADTGTGGTSAAPEIRMTFDNANGNVGINETSPNTTLDVKGGQTVNITTVSTTTYNVLITDYVIQSTIALTNTSTVTLPTAQNVRGRVVKIKDVSAYAAVRNITIDTQGGEKIDGEDTFVIDVAYGAIEIYSDGTNWYTL